MAKKTWVKIMPESKRQWRRQINYWRRRERENYEANAREEIDIDKEIERIHREMLRKIQDDINVFYAKYADRNGITITEAKKRVTNLDIKEYERKAREYVKNQDLSPQANAEMAIYNLTMKVNRLELLKAEIGLDMVGSFDELEKLTGQVLTKRAVTELRRQAGILGKTVHRPEDRAESIVGASFQNASFSDRIWTHQTILKSELDQLLTTGIVQGKNPRELAKKLRENVQSSIYNSERLMRTELARVQTDSQKKVLEENGYKRFIFISLESGCEICKALDGHDFPVDKLTPGCNAPPIHPHCRCSIAAYEDDNDFNAWLDELVGPEEGEV